MSKAETSDGTNKLKTKEEKEAHYRETIARAEKMRERARQRPRDDQQCGFELKLADEREYSARMWHVNIKGAQIYGRRIIG